MIMDFNCCIILNKFFFLRCVLADIYSLLCVYNIRQTPSKNLFLFKVENEKKNGGNGWETPG